MTTLALELSDVRVRYRGGLPGRASEVLALDGVSLSLSAGECVGVAGPRGAGKTTLLLCAAGILNPDSGTVRSARAEYVARSGGAQPFLSVRASLEFAASMRELSGLEPGPVESVLERAGLTAWSRVRLGELPPARRACALIAHALLAEPALLCVDELAADGSVDEARDFAALLASLGADGIAVLVSTRHPARLGGIATRVLELESGRVAATAAGVSTLELDVALPRHAAAILSNRVPSVRRRGRALCVSLDRISPEEVLSTCVSLGISVYASRVVASVAAGRVAEGKD